MSLYYIVDGYNVTVTYCERFPGTKRNSRDRLINLVLKERPQGSINNKITIVFDGQPGVTSPKETRLDVRYTSGHDADWYIKRMVSKSDKPKSIIVVTDDRGIIREVSQHGAKAMSVKAFIQRLFPAKPTKEEPQKNMSAEDIEDINRFYRKKKGI